ncbi:MAG: MoaD/ThiS family protein [Halofilum sp. (in: g-proteobacteria)]|nr:MoaD/ThiS family protein [Halofilum sp. (in: g-proteobacteria)]
MPEASLRIPTPLQPFTDGSAEIAVDADTVGAAIARAGEQYPPLLHQVLTRDGQVRRYVNVFVRQQDIRQLDGLDTPLENGDEIIVMPSVAGG